MNRFADLHPVIAEDLKRRVPHINSVQNTHRASPEFGKMRLGEWFYKTYLVASMPVCEATHYLFYAAYSAEALRTIIAMYEHYGWNTGE